jgi:4-aminobutyrate aminotransferase-like enzyme
MVLKAGLYNNCVRLHPPLIIEEDILDVGMDILEAAVKKA